MTEERIQEIKQIVHDIYEVTESSSAIFLCLIVEELLDYIESITV